MADASRQSETERYDRERRIVRLTDGTIYAYKPVWTARVAVVRANCKGANASVIWVTVLFYGLFGVLIGLPLWISASQAAEWPDYLAFVALAAGLGLALYVIARLLAGAKITAAYRETAAWLYGSDAGRLLADETWYQLIRAGLEERPWLKGLLPPPPRNFEQQLESAAVYCRLLWQISRRPRGRLAGMGGTALYYRTSSACGVPAALTCCVLSCFGSFIGSLLFVPASLGIAASVLTRNARLLAICDYLLDEADPACTLGWMVRLEDAPKLHAATGAVPHGLRPAERNAADIMRDAARDAAHDRMQRRE